MSLPPASVEASRAQRIQRHQARYRDRGGIFKPADHNPLLDLLLARGVNGESPSRTNSPHPSPSRSTSPRRNQPVSHPPHSHPSKPPPATNTSARKRRNSTRKLTNPDEVAHDSQNALHDPSAAPGTSIAVQSAPSRKGRAPKATNNSTRSKSSRAAPPPPPDSSDDDSPLLARSKNSRPRENPPKTKEKPAKPKQTRNRKVPPQTSVPASHVEVLTDDEAPATTSRKQVQKKATNASSSRSKVAVVAKLTTETEGLADVNPVPARSRRNPKVQSVQPLETDSEHPAASKKSARGKLKAKSPEEEDFASQVPHDRATAKKATKRNKTDTNANNQSDASKGSTNAPKSGAQPSTSRETKKRKKPTAPTTSNDLATAGGRADLDSDSEKQPPPSRSPSPRPEPARKRPKARQAVDEDDQVTEEREPRNKNRRPSRQVGNAEDAKNTRKVSRSKAPPIPMPNGVRLKPKPRPRLSMFQPPPDDNDDSDRDPIDFLS